MKTGAILVSIEITRLKFDCLVKIREGRVEIAFLLVCQAAINIGTGLHVLRKYLVDFYHLIVIGNSSINITIAHLLVAAFSKSIRLGGLCRMRIALRTPPACFLRKFKACLSTTRLSPSSN